MKIIKYLGFGLLSVFIFFIGMAVITTINKADPAETFIPFIKENMPEVAKWDLAVFKKLMTEEALGTATPEQWQMYIKKVSTLGKLESIGPFTLENSYSTTSISGNTKSTIVYLVPLNFDTGLAHARIILVHTEESGVKIQHIKFLADRLMQ